MPHRNPTQGNVTIIVAPEHSTVRAETAAADLDRPIAFHRISSIGPLRLVNSLALAVGRFVGGVFRRRAAIRELRALSDRQLTDIGLERSRFTALNEETIETGGHPAAWIVRRKR